MRKDMAQLLVEHPRHNSGETYRIHRRRANRAPDDAPSKEGMRRLYRERKEFGEYLPPLKGFLRKNVGRPWDKVFSELSASLHGGGTVIQHTKMHLLNDFVELHPVWRGNVPYSPPHTMYGGESLPLSGEYYVDRQGILRWAPKIRYRYQRAPAPRVPIDAQSAYYQIDGAWFRVWLKPLLLAYDGPLPPPVYDVVIKRWVRCRERPAFFGIGREWYVDGTRGPWDLEHAHGQQQLVAVRKEQISSHTIRKECLNERLAQILGR